MAAVETRGDISAEEDIAGSMSTMVVDIQE